MRQPSLETANEVADVWMRWLSGGEQNRWVMAMRACASKGVNFMDWGTGLPERKLRILPFCLEAVAADGTSLGQVFKLAELRKLAA